MLSALNATSDARLTPLVAGTVMRSEFDSVRNSIPHVRVTAAQVHLHPQTCRLFRVLSIFHSVELVQRLFNRTISVDTGDRVTFATSSILLDLFGCRSACAHYRLG